MMAAAIHIGPVLTFQTFSFYFFAFGRQFAARLGESRADRGMAGCACMRAALCSMVAVIDARHGFTCGHGEQSWGSGGAEYSCLTLAKAGAHIAPGHQSILRAKDRLSSRVRAALETQASC